MTRTLFVSFVTIILAAATVSAQTTTTPPLQKGVSVEMAVTTQAQPMPEADNESAWIVSVTEDGKLYFGINPVTPEELEPALKSLPRNRQARLYVKADARAPFASVEQALEAARRALFETPVLLTSQREPIAAGTVVPPNGLEVLIAPALPAGTVATVVQLLNSGPQPPPLSVNGDEISWSALEGTLRRHFQKGDEKMILLKAAERLPFGQVVQVIDVCRSTGAKVFLPTPEL